MEIHYGEYVKKNIFIFFPLQIYNVILKSLKHSVRVIDLLETDWWSVFELFRIVSKMNTIFYLNIDSLLLKEVNGNEFRYWVVLSDLDVLTTWTSIARLKYIIVCRLNDSSVFSGKRFLWWSLESSQTKTPDTHSTMFCTVGSFFSWYWAVRNQGRIFIRCVVVGVSMCSCIMSTAMLMKNSTSLTLLQK